MKPTTTNVDFYNILLAQLVEIHTTVSATDSESATGQQQHQHHHQQQQQQENQQQDDQQLLQLLLQLQEEEQTRGDGGDGGGTFLFNRNNRQYFVVNTSDSNNFDEFTCRYDNAMTAFSNQTKAIKQPTSQPTIHPSFRNPNASKHFVLSQPYKIINPTIFLHARKTKTATTNAMQNIKSMHLKKSKLSLFCSFVLFFCSSSSFPILHHLPPTNQPIV